MTCTFCLEKRLKGPSMSSICDREPVHSLSTPLIVYTVVYASTNETTIFLNQKVTSTIPNLKPLPWILKLPLVDREITHVYAKDFSVLPGYSPCTITNFNPVSVALIPPNFVVLFNLILVV